MTHDKAQNFTDIKDNAGLLKILPVYARPYALLMRLDRPIGTWLLLLPGLCAIALASGGLGGLNSFTISTYCLFAIGAIIMRGAGCVINDLWDRNLDKAVERTATRPLASGAISPRNALIFLGILFLCGFIILIQFNITTILLGILTLPLIATYPLMKRITWWPQFFLGLTFNFGALMGWAAINGTISLSALALYSGGIFWTLGYDTIYAHQDREDDIKIGIKSSALRMGNASKKGVTLFYIGCFALFTTSFILASAGWLSYALLLLAGAHLYHQIRIWDVTSQPGSLRVFKSNRNFGLLLLCAALL